MTCPTNPNPDPTQPAETLSAMAELGLRSPLSLLEQQPLLLSLGAARVQTAASYLEGYVGRERLAEFVRLHPLSRRSKPDPNPNPNPNPNQAPPRTLTRGRAVTLTGALTLTLTLTTVALTLTPTLTLTR